jgi:hypothetical protein
MRGQLNVFLDSSECIFSTHKHSTLVCVFLFGIWRVNIPRRQVVFFQGPRPLSRPCIRVQWLTHKRQKGVEGQREHCPLVALLPRPVWMSAIQSERVSVSPGTDKTCPWRWFLSVHTLWRGRCSACGLNRLCLNVSPLSPLSLSSFLGLV